MRCYVLAGGRSVRMGVEKAAIVLHGRTFLDRVLDALQGFDETVIVASDPTYQHPFLRTIHDRPASRRAAIHGVITALEDTAAGKAWITAVDFPLLTSAIVSALAARFEDDANPLLVPQWHGQPQMLCAGYDAALLPQLYRIAAASCRLRDLLDSVSVTLIDEAELRSEFRGEALWNVNDPQELEKVVAFDEHSS